ncbi:MAG: sigma-70 family RNA polymerase sigma factor [Pirellulales bacterium]
MPSSSDQTSQLIAAARRADRQSLSTLLELFRNYLRLLARTGIDTTLRGKADPSDLVQETMIKATQNFDGFRGQSEAELAAWLRQILAQCLIHHARHYRASTRRVTRERSLTDLLEQSSMHLSALAAGRANLSESLPQGRDAGVVLAEAMAQLSDDYREVITLRNLEQLEWAQVAKKMGRSADAVRMLWLRALKQLRPLVEARI